ncbi:MAG: hypothetical protein K0S65_5597, partial [Labilithrix sp.]|nr:hypothetical protein [Labilithrix sp.]
SDLGETRLSPVPPLAIRGRRHPPAMAGMMLI